MMKKTKWLLVILILTIACSNDNSGGNVEGTCVPDEMQECSCTNECQICKEDAADSDNCNCSNTNGDSDIDTNTDANTDTETDTFTDIDTDEDTDTNADTDTLIDEVIESVHCPPLPLPTGEENIVYVSTVAQLWEAMYEAVPHTTIMLADGTYNLGEQNRYLWIDTPYLTIRSASGNREAVILDDNYSRAHIISIIASNVTIADITIKRTYTNAIYVLASSLNHTLDTLIYNVHIIDPAKQAISVSQGAQEYYPDNGTIACSTIELTDAGRTHIRNNCDTGGIDIFSGQGWVIRDNHIFGFWCSQGLSKHGIQISRGSRDTIVERNILHNNAQGIGFGQEASLTVRTYDDDPCPDASDYVDNYGGIIRNNFIFANETELFASANGLNTGISLWNACDVGVFHNTVVSTQSPFSSIEWRFQSTSVQLVNNLVSHDLIERNDATATQAGNLIDAPLTLFVDGPGGDLHLLPTALDAIDQGAHLESGLCDEDIDGDERPIGSARDIGADEYSSSLHSDIDVLGSN